MLGPLKIIAHILEWRGKSDSNRNLYAESSSDEDDSSDSEQESEVVTRLLKEQAKLASTVAQSQQILESINTPEVNGFDLNGFMKRLAKDTSKLGTRKVEAISSDQQFDELVKLAKVSPNSPKLISLKEADIILCPRLLNFGNTEQKHWYLLIIRRTLEGFTLECLDGFNHEQTHKKIMREGKSFIRAITGASPEIKFTMNTVRVFQQDNSVDCGYVVAGCAKLMLADGFNLPEILASFYREQQARLGRNDGKLNYASLFRDEVRIVSLDHLQQGVYWRLGSKTPLITGSKTPIDLTAPEPLKRKISIQDMTGEDDQPPSHKKRAVSPTSKR